MAAERAHIDRGDIADGYDDIEKTILEGFYEYVGERKDAEWVHWSMRDVNYGFPALEHRMKVLRGDPVEISEQKKFDLSRALVTLYGRGYAAHPRMKSLMSMNDMTFKDFLDGEHEAAAFGEGRYMALHQSTLRKVDTFCNFLEGAIDGTLRTKSRWRDRHDLDDVMSAVKRKRYVGLLGLLAVLEGTFGFLRKYVMSLFDG